MKRLLPFLLLTALPAQAAGLRELATRALHHDPRMGAATADIAVARSQVMAAEAGDLPQVMLSADLGVSNLQTDAFFPQSGSRVPNTLTLGASQPLYAGGRVRAQQAVAAHAVDAALERRRDIGGKLILATLTAVLDLKRDRETLRLAEANQAALKQARSDTERRLAAGEATRTDLAQADARLAEGQAGLRRAAAQGSASEASLRRLIGELPPGLDPAWPEKLPLAKSLEEALRQSAQAPAPRAADHQAEAMADQVVVSTAEGRPRVNLDAYGLTRDDSEFGYERLSTWALQLKFQMPLYTGGLVAGHVGEAQARAEAARQMAADTEALYAETTAREWALVQADEDVLHAARLQLAAAQLALDGVRKELAVGSRTSLDLLDAQRELLAAQLSEVEALHDRAVTGFRLLAICGQLELYNVPE